MAHRSEKKKKERKREGESRESTQCRKSDTFYPQSDANQSLGTFHILTAISACDPACSAYYCGTTADAANFRAFPEVVEHNSFVQFNYYILGQYREREGERELAALASPSSGDLRRGDEDSQRKEKKRGQKRVDVGQGGGMKGVQGEGV